MDGKYLDAYEIQAWIGANEFYFGHTFNLENFLEYIYI